MLPIFRILPVGGVLLAITLLALALNPPASMHANLTPGVVPMRGAMIEQSAHPEWRQFLLLAAIRRTDELNRLRELPDTAVRIDDAPAPPAATAAPAEPKLTVLPTERNDTDPDADDTTGSIMQPPAATIPIDIGEPSAFELPVATPEEKPPVIRTPLRLKSDNENRLTGGPRTRRAKAAIGLEPPGPLDPYRTIFSDQKAKQQQPATR
jgi:hypothetical protein